jgi:pimeloyl-ACP methyl ester carboxylesterase
VILKGWQGHADGPPKATLIYLHGVSDNRASASGVLDHFRRRGFNVVAYDSRAHGESGGEAATFGCFEKEDLRHVLDTLRPGPIILVGSSLGAAVALQTAALDPRITAVARMTSSQTLGPGRVQARDPRPDAGLGVGPSRGGEGVSSLKTPGRC